MLKAYIGDLFNRSMRNSAFNIAMKEASVELGGAVDGTLLDWKQASTILGAWLKKSKENSSDASLAIHIILKQN